MFNKNKEIQKFKKIIKFAVDSLEKDENGICIEIRIEKYLELIIDYFCELTNINKILVNYDCSIQDIYKKLPFILLNLKKCSEDNFLNEFIFQVHQYIKSCDNKYNFEQHFLFYTNIDKFKYSNDENFKEILSFFNLSIFDPNKFIVLNDYIIDKSKREGLKIRNLRNLQKNIILRKGDCMIRPLTYIIK